MRFSYTLLDQGWYDRNADLRDCKADLDSLREFYPELRDWPDAALAEAWAAFCNASAWAGWFGAYDDPAFLGYLILEQEGNLPDALTMFHDHEVFREAAARAFEVSTAELTARWSERRSSEAFPAGDAFEP